MTRLSPEIEFFRACALKGAISLQARGMRHSRLSGTQLLAQASTITGKTYKRGQYAQAKQDLQAWCDKQHAERTTNVVSGR